MTDIFNSTQEETNSENSNDTARQTADILVNKLLEIKREDGSPKYESVESALDALKVTQDHIKTIEAENAALRAKTAESDQLKETLQRLQEKNVNEEKPSDKTNTNGGLSEEAVKELVRNQLVEEETNKKAISNIKSVQDVLINKLGTREKAQEYVVNKAAELGLSPEALKQLSATSPNAALALLGEVVKPPVSSNSSSVRIPLGNPSSDEIKAPEVSLLSGRGATTRNQIDHVKRIKEKVYRDLNIN